MGLLDLPEKTARPVSAADGVTARSREVAPTKSHLKVLVLKNVWASWVDRDLKMLEKHFDVEVFHATKTSLLHLGVWIPKLWRADRVLAWFGSLHFFPVILVGWLMRKKIVVIAGGYDVDRVPEIDYGAFCRPWWSRTLRKLLFKMSSKVLAVSRSTLRETLKNVGLPQSKVDLVYHGFEQPSVSLMPWGQRKDQIVMISSAHDKDFRLKGLDQLLLIAERMPHRQFILVGQISPANLQVIESRGLKNLHLTGFLPFQGVEFEKIIGESKIVLQPSFCESFGAAVVDAGLRGCYPIVFSQFALTEVVDQIGTAVTYNDLNTLSQEIDRILALPDLDVHSIQRKFLNRFHISNREAGLIRALES